jgi:hypothetical protein
MHCVFGSDRDAWRCRAAELGVSSQSSAALLQQHSRENLAQARGAFVVARRLLRSAVDAQGDAGRQEAWFSSLRALHALERRQLWRACDDLAACSGAAGQHVDECEETDRIQGQLAAVQLLRLRALEEVTGVEERRLEAVAQKLRAVADEKASVADECERALSSRRAELASVCHLSGRVHVLTDEEKRVFTAMWLEVETSLRGATLRLSALNQRQKTRVLATAELSGCSTFVPTSKLQQQAQKGSRTEAARDGIQQQSAASHNKRSKGKGKGKGKGKQRW